MKNSQAEDALTSLCKVYWRPLYIFVRCRGYSYEDAQDLTQSYFSMLLTKKHFKAADKNKGRFRTFLLSSLKYFLANEYDKKNAQKRGGGKVAFLSEVNSAESDFEFDPADNVTPESVFDKYWALSVIEKALDQMQFEFEGSSKGKQFEALKVFLTGDSQLPSYLEVAQKLKTSEGAVKVMIHRLRKRFREVLEAIIRETLDDPEDFNDELEFLFKAVGNSL